MGKISGVTGVGMRAIGVGVAIRITAGLAVGVHVGKSTGLGVGVGVGTWASTGGFSGGNGLKLTQGLIKTKRKIDPMQTTISNTTTVNMFQTSVDLSALDRIESSEKSNESIMSPTFLRDKSHNFTLAKFIRNPLF